MTATPRVVLGYVARPHGLQGEVVLRDVTLSGEELRALPELLLVGVGARWERPAQLASTRPFGRALLARFAGCETIEQANELRGATLQASRADLPEPAPDEVYVFELVGLTVVDEEGRELGTVREVVETGAHEVLDIAPADASTGAPALLLPYRPEFVLGWDREARRLRVRVPPGLEEVYKT